jgi:phage replication O-like protein O
VSAATTDQLTPTLRDAYADVGAAIRQAQERAKAAGDLTGRDLRVLVAVIAQVSSYSRLCDGLTVKQIADVAGVDERNTARALQRLRERGVIVREASRGRRPALTGLHPAALSSSAQPRPETATVETPQPRPPATMVAGREPRPETAMVPDANHGQSRHPTMAAHGHPPEKNSEKTSARAPTREADPDTATAAASGSRTPVPDVAAAIRALPDGPWSDRIATVMIEQHVRREQLEIRIGDRGDELAATAAARMNCALEQEALVGRYAAANPEAPGLQVAS